MCDDTTSTAAPGKQSRSGSGREQEQHGGFVHVIRVPALRGPLLARDDPFARGWQRRLPREHARVGQYVASQEGRFAVHDSEASNLVDDDTNGQRDVFAHDRQTQTQTTTLAMRDSGSPTISADGR